MFYEQRGPLVFSASLHLALLVGASLYLLITPDKKPEELVFQLVSTPAASEAPRNPAQDQPMQPIRYQSEQFELPTLDEIVLPERPPIQVEVEMPQPERVEPKPEPVEQPTVEVEQPQAISWEEFRRMNPDADRTKSVRTTPRETTRKIDLTEDVRRLRESLSKVSIASLPTAQIEAMSASDQQAISSYFDRFAAALRRAVEKHPMRGQPLRVQIAFDIAANGRITNARVTSSSGDAEFDQKALAGLRRLSIFEPTPSGRSEAVRFWFEQ